jgi:hypothetical protein
MAPLETTTPETGDITGTKDKDYNIIWFTEQCLSNALRLEVYIQDAERENDSELVEFFRKAQHESQKGAEQGKELLKSRRGVPSSRPWSRPRRADLRLGRCRKGTGSSSTHSPPWRACRSCRGRR